MPRKDPTHWQRQLAVLKLVERLDNDALSILTPQLAKHPFDKIRERIVQRTKQAGQEVILAPTGGYELVRIPGGEFLMGSPESEKGRYKYESPQHMVHVPDFYMGRYPVTNEEYGRYLSENPKVPEPKYWADRQYNQPRQPVVGVSWDDAQQYARWAGLQLPSEAQWEYACRVGTNRPYYSGDSETARRKNSCKQDKGPFNLCFWIRIISETCSYAQIIKFSKLVKTSLKYSTKCYIY